MGGFHLMNSSRNKVLSIITKMKDMGVCKVGPTHCTGSEAEILFREAYGVNFLNIMSGQIVEI